MNRDTGLQGAEARRIFERARAAASTPLSLHQFDDKHETEAVATCGHCESCRFVADLPWGKQACRRSREKAGVAALRRKRPVPFLCHMGFSCVSSPATLSEDNTCVVTLGPFCPAEAPGSLEADALKGFQALENKDSTYLPFSLSDIPLVSASAVPSIAEWLTETLTDHCTPDPQPNQDLSPEEDNGSQTVTKPGGQRNRGRVVFDAYHAANIAAALSGGNQRQARDLVKGIIADTPARKRLSTAVRRARTLALTSAVLEAAERADMNTTRCWERLPQFHEAVRRARNQTELCAAAMAVLGILKRKAVAKNNDSNQSIVKLNRIVTERLADTVTLQDVAKVLGERPSAITKRLQRKFGMSFTEYVGRMRADKAKDLLRRTNLRVIEVARRVGLNDAGNFSKLFRKHEGIAPTEYRKRFGRSR